MMHLSLRAATLFISLVSIGLGLPVPAFGQTDPSNFTTVINVPPDPAPSSIGTSTQLNLGPGGVIGHDFLAGAPDGSSTDVEVNISGGTVGDDFSAYRGSIVNVSGGIIGDFFIASDGSVINLSGGTIGEQIVLPLSGSVFNISGGVIRGRLDARAGSVVNMSGGTLLGGNFASRAWTGSAFEISGGTIDTNFVAEGGSVVRMTGGTVGADFTAISDSVELVGGEFELNGVSYNAPSINLTGADVFTGTLSDGSVFIFTAWASDRLDNVTLTQATLPTLDTTPIVVDSTNPIGPTGLRDGQSLTLRGGGSLKANFAVVDAALNIEGGAVGRGLEVYGGTISMTGGTVGSDSGGSAFLTYSGSVVNISGGTIVGRIQAYLGSEVNIDGGTVNTGITASSGSVLNISGGTVGDSSRASSGSVVSISGGSVGSAFRAEAGSRVTLSGGTVSFDFNAFSGSQVELIGGEFELNGVSFVQSSISLTPGDVFTGTLADGSPFLFSDLASDNLVDVVLTAAVLPELDTSPIVVDGSGSAAPAGLRPGQSLTLRNQGVLKDDFAVVDATLDVEGGVVGEDIEIVRSVLNMSGGTADGRMSVFNDSVVNISAGTLRGGIDAYSGSQINITGGTAQGGYEAAEGGLVNISGGTILGDSIARSGSTVNIRGGAIGLNFGAASGSNVNLFGTDFVLDGVTLENLIPGQAFTIVDRSVNLTGVFEDGSAFSFDLNARSGSQAPFFAFGSTLTVTLVTPVPEPTLLSLVVAGGLATIGRRRRMSFPVQTKAC